MMTYGIGDPMPRLPSSFKELRGTFLASGHDFMYMKVNLRLKDVNSQKEMRKQGTHGLIQTSTPPRGAMFICSSGDFRIFKISKADDQSIFNMKYVVAWSGNLKMRARRSIRSAKKHTNFLKTVMFGGFYMQFELLSTSDYEDGYVICETRPEIDPSITINAGSGGGGGSGGSGLEEME
jgi:hypothetical protein